MTKEQTKNPYHPFTLEQKVAFALASNWAINQSEGAMKTAHFFTVAKKKGALKADAQIDLLKGLIEKIRNLTSHQCHSDNYCLTIEDVEMLDKLQLATAFEYINRNWQAQQSDGLSKEEKENRQQILDFITLKDSRLFHFEQLRLTDHKQPELAFILGLFLNREQIGFLSGKLYFGEDLDSVEVQAKKALLNCLAQPVNVIRRMNEQDTDQWLNPEHEFAFALWEYLRTRQENGSEWPLDDRYFMRQLIGFIIHKGILEGFAFSRVETTTSDDDKDDDKLEQKRVYSNDQGKPLNIRYNTIAVEHQKSGVKGTLGLRALLYIVISHLHGKEGVADFVRQWFADYANYSHRKNVSKGGGKSIDDHRIKARCDYLIGLYENKKKTPPNLQNQIRFITRRIAVAWQKKYGKAFSKHEYKDLEDKVRYYHKQDLCGYLTETKIDNQQGIGLGRGDEKSLKHAIKKDRIQDVYKDMVGDHDAYLKGVREGIHKKGDEEKERIAKAIGCRLPSSSSALPSMPVGLPERVLRQEYFSEEKTTPKLVDLINKRQSLGDSTVKKPAPKLVNPIKKLVCPYYFHDAPSDKTKDATKQRDQWCKKQLLLCMAWDIVKTLMNNKNNKGEYTGRDSGDKIPPLADIGCSLMFDDKNIITKFGQSWRDMSKLDEGFVSKLIEHYLNDAKEVPLLRSDENKSGQSIESALIERFDERYFFIQAILQWECDWLKKNYNSVQLCKEGGEQYVKFSEIASKAGLDNKVTDFRNKGFHDDLPNDGRFSDCPEPIKSIYETLKKAGRKTI